MNSVEVDSISVVIPAYNCEATLVETLESLQAQSFERWEAIVVDDGSADGTAALAERFAERDPRVRLHRQENRGVGGARNAGIELARSPWMFFLDADDVIVPEAFEILTAAAAGDSDAGAVLAGARRVDGDGRRLRSQAPGHHADHFALFARVCAIVIHSCLVRTDLVRRAGGFDESLVTCEDWDLWQRIARLGTRFVTIEDDVAVYRMSAGTASHDGRRMLRDGLLVIDRGHGPDERVAAVEPPDLELPSPAARDAARTYFACYAAGLEMALGHDARWVVAALGDGITGVDPDGVAETICIALADGRVAAPGDWAGFPPEIHALCRDFLTELGDRLGDHWLAHGAREALERMALRAGDGREEGRVGRWQLLNLDVEDGIAGLELEEGVEILLGRVCWGEEEIGDVEVPVAGGAISARVLADAIVAAHAWDLLGAFQERHQHPGLEIELGPGSARVAREGAVLFEGELDPQRPQRLALHDEIGWTLFLQDLWDRPGMSSAEFYEESPRGAEAAEEREAGAGPVELEMTEPMPALRRRGAGNIDLAIRVAGVPLGCLRAWAPDGRLSAHLLRREILVGCGFELCRAVLREALLLAPPGAGGSLRERLLAAREVRGGGPVVDPGTAVVGRAEGAEGTAASRWLPLPLAALRERLRVAELDEDPLCGPVAGAEALLSAPLVLDRVRRAPGSLGDDSLLRSLEFEQTFAAEADPWRLGSLYEQGKYELTLAMVPEGVERAIELGCAEGHFSERLAGAVGHLTAADVSSTALSRARRRCAGRDNVEFARLDVFAGEIGGPYDLVVCSELLYYAGNREALDRSLAGIAAGLEPGGHLLAAHANVVADEPDRPGFDWEVPFGAATIAAALKSGGEFDLREESRTDAYRLQLWRRRRGGLRLPRLRPRPRRVAAAGPEGMEEFLPRGGEVRRRAAEPASTATRLPILMYHRVAPEGAEATARWRLHPEAFEEQLAYLREAGYCALDFDQWRAASDRRHPIPERAVMLTFDDGYADFPEFAQPLLAKYDFQATMFVVTDLVGESNRWDAVLGEEIELMGWDEIAALAGAGVEIGSHSSSHQALVSLSAAELAEDFCRSRRRFHERLGFAVRSLCYPYGLHDATVRTLAGACGFHYGVTTNEWRASFGEDLLALPRLEVRGDTDLDGFRALLER